MLGLVHRDPIKIHAAHTISIFSAIEPDAGLIMGEGDGQFGLINFCADADQRGAIVLEVAPGYVFGLDEVGGEIAIAGRRIRSRILHSLADNLVNAGDGLASTAMAHANGKALLAIVIAPKLRARLIRNY